MGIVLFFILFFVLALCVTLIVIFNKKKKQKGFVGAMVGAIASIICLIIFPGGFYQVEAGEAALIKEFGKAQRVEEPGLKWRLWFKDEVVIYDLKVQQIESQIAAYSQDAQTMDADVVVQYRIESDKIKEINQEFGSIQTLTTRLDAVAIEKTKVVLASSSAMKIIENRNTLSKKVEEEIMNSAEQYHVIITMVTVNNIDFNDSFESAVEQKMIAEQQQLQAEFDKKKAIIKAEEALEVAKLAAEAELAKAKAEGEAIKVKANAEAEAIKIKSVEAARMLGFRITEDNEIDTTGKSAEEIAVISEYLKYIEYLQAWDGELPTVVGDSTAVVMPNPTK